MKAVAINEFGGSDKLEVMDLPCPEPGADEVLVQVKASGVNPVDWKIREGWFKDFFPHEFPLILGWDAAGTVASVGENVRKYKAGNDVYAYCRKPEIKEGAYAAYIRLPLENVAPKPERMSFEEAASVPLAALTAYQALFDAADLQPGETVFIHAASGGVGTFAVQLAKDHGAYVIGTASAKNHEYLRELGADVPIDYHTQDLADIVCNQEQRRADVVFDCIGGGALSESQKLTKAGSRNVSIVDTDAVQNLKDADKHAQFVFVEPNAEQLSRITHMIDSDRITTTISATYPLEEAVKAHEQIASGHTRGKIVLVV